MQLRKFAHSRLHPLQKWTRCPYNEDKTRKSRRQYRFASRAGTSPVPFRYRNPPRAALSFPALPVYRGKSRCRFPQAGYGGSGCRGPGCSAMVSAAGASKHGFTRIRPQLLREAKRGQRVRRLIPGTGSGTLKGSSTVKGLPSLSTGVLRYVSNTNPIHLLSPPAQYDRKGNDHERNQPKPKEPKTPEHHAGRL